MRIAVTGATGFLGRRIVEQAAAQGHSVIATSRGRTGSTDFGGRASFTPCDITDANALTRIFDGCDVVVHSAALSSDWGQDAQFWRINVDGTKAVVAAAERAGVRRLVHISSTSVYFAFEDRFDVREDASLPAPVNAYARTKRAAEDVARSFPGEIFVARPRGLFGPDDPHLLPRLLKVAEKRPLPLLRDGRAQVDITDVGVAADAILAMAGADVAAADTYNVSHGEPIAIRNLVERLFSGLVRPLRWRAMPVSVALAGARTLELAARIDPRRRPPLITAYALGLFAYSQTLDLAKARRKLGWRPKLGRDEALERTIAAARTSA
jgi:nucleoside-diphosphate-sugar epimerase